MIWVGAPIIAMIAPSQALFLSYEEDYLSFLEWRDLVNGEQLISKGLDTTNCVVGHGSQHRLLATLLANVAPGIHTLSRPENLTLCNGQILRFTPNKSRSFFVNSLVRLFVYLSCLTRNKINHIADGAFWTTRKLKHMWVAIPLAINDFVWPQIDKYLTCIIYDLIIVKSFWNSICSIHSLLEKNKISSISKYTFIGAIALEMM